MAEAMQAITMPRWGMTMTEGTVSSWLVGEGAALEPETEVAEIETTKIANLLEAGRAGTLRRIVAAPGAVMPVGALLAVIADPAVPEAEIDAFVAARALAYDADATDAAPAARLIDAGGRKINVLTLGDGAGLPVVLIHGFGGEIGSWLFTQGALAADRPVHALDLPAHGASAPDVGDGGVKALEDAVLAVLEARRIGSAPLGGHSLGGAVAAGIAARAPERVTSLTLIATAGLGTEVGVDYVARFLAAEKRRDVKAVLGSLFADPSVVTRDMIEGVQRNRRIDGVPEALALIAAAAFPDGRQGLDIRPALARVTAPVLVIWGGKDAVLAPVDDLPDTLRQERIPEAGHMLMMEAATTVNRLLADHISAAEG